jgi:hypothetical protein
VEKIAQHPLLCYLNADIIMTGSFISAIQSIPFRKFLMVGQRWDVDISERVNFGSEGWNHHLKKYVAEKGTLHPPTGIDYFVFPRGVMGVLPPFAVGRPGWDNWLIYRARALSVPVVDVTRVVTAIHQNHDYDHVKLATDGASDGPEAEDNRKLIGGWEYFFTIRDANYCLKPYKTRAGGSCFHIRTNLRTLPLPALKACKKLSYIAGAGIRALKRRFTIG